MSGRSPRACQTPRGRPDHGTTLGGTWLWQVESHAGLVAPAGCLASRHGERVCHLLPREDGVVGIDQLDPDLVLARRQIGYVDRVVVTGISPPPGQVVDRDVQMSTVTHPTITLGAVESVTYRTMVSVNTLV